MKIDSIDVGEKAREKYPECFGENPKSFNDGHLGGTNTSGDPSTFIHPNVWGHLVNNFGVKSILDIGCGFGFAIKFIKDNFEGVDVDGVEGSPKVVDLCLFPDNITQHDYTTGAFVPDKTYDLGWSTEFVEHVEEKYAYNFIETFKKCKYVAFTFASIGQGGHHHVNENTQEYWVDKMSESNFEFLEKETLELRDLAVKDMEQCRGAFPEQFFIFHFQDRGILFKNNSLS